MTGGRNNSARLEAASKQKQALELRRAGATYDAIASQLGYRNPSGAQYAVDAALKRTLQEPADALRKLEGDRLDRLMVKYWQAAINGDRDAAEMVLKIMARRARLFGLDMAKDVSGTSVNVTVINGIDLSAVLGQAPGVPLERISDAGPN